MKGEITNGINETKDRGVGETYITAIKKEQREIKEKKKRMV